MGEWTNRPPSESRTTVIRVPVSTPAKRRRLASVHTPSAIGSMELHGDGRRCTLKEADPPVPKPVLRPEERTDPIVPRRRIDGLGVVGSRMVTDRQDHLRDAADVDEKPALAGGRLDPDAVLVLHVPDACH